MCAYCIAGRQPGSPCRSAGQVIFQTRLNQRRLPYPLLSRHLRPVRFHMVLILINKL